jgi:hypothetical protein
MLELRRMRLYIAASVAVDDSFGYFGAYGLVNEVNGQQNEHWGQLRCSDAALPKFHAILRVLEPLFERDDSSEIDIGILTKGIGLKLRLEAKAAKLLNATQTERAKLLSSNNPEVRAAQLWNAIKDRPMRPVLRDSQKEKGPLKRAHQIARSKRKDLIEYYQRGEMLRSGEIVEDKTPIEFPREMRTQRDS